MIDCRHLRLVLLPEEARRVQCQQCHLTLTESELGEGWCPECFDTSGKKQYDFKEIPALKTGIVKYRCEECGIIIEQA